MNWSSKWFYFLVLSFLLFTIAGGYGPKWKTIFTTTVTNPDSVVGGGISPTASIAPIAPIAPLQV